MSDKSVPGCKQRVSAPYWFDGSRDSRKPGVQSHKDSLEGISYAAQPVPGFPESRFSISPTGIFIIEDWFWIEDGFLMEGSLIRQSNW